MHDRSTTPYLNLRREVFDLLKMCHLVLISYSCYSGHVTFSKLRLLPIDFVGLWDFSFSTSYRRLIFIGKVCCHGLGQLLYGVVCICQVFIDEGHHGRNLIFSPVVRFCSGLVSRLMAWFMIKKAKQNKQNKFDIQHHMIIICFNSMFSNFDILKTRHYFIYVCLKN